MIPIVPARPVGTEGDHSVLADLEQANAMHAQADALQDAALRRAQPILAAAVRRLRLSSRSGHDPLQVLSMPPHAFCLCLQSHCNSSVRAKSAHGED